MTEERRRAVALYNEAMELWDAGEVSQAEKLLRDALSLAPRWGRACLALASLLRYDGRDAEAVAAARRATVTRFSPAAFSFLASVSEEVGETEEAIELYRRAFREEPTPARATIIGWLAADPTVAREWYERALELDPYYDEAHFNLGIHYRFAGDERRAIEYLTRAAELDREDGRALAELAFARITGEDISLEEARSLLKKACALAPGYAWGHVYLARVLSVLGDVEGAEEALARAERVDPTIGDLYLDEEAGLGLHGDPNGTATEFSRSRGENDPEMAGPDE